MAEFLFSFDAVAHGYTTNRHLVQEDLYRDIELLADGASVRKALDFPAGSVVGAHPIMSAPKRQESSRLHYE